MPATETKLQPSEERRFAAYSNHYERIGNERCDWNYAESHASQFACRQPWLPADRGAHILDFGCGWGKQLLSLWCAGYRNLEGVEVAQDQAAIALQGVAGRFPVHCGDGRVFLQSRESAYDLVVLNDVIEHVPREETGHLLDCISRSLRPGGRIVVRTPNMSSLLAGYSRYMDVTHVTGFTEFSLLQVLEEAGFRDARFVREYFGWPPRTRRPWIIVRRLDLRGLFNEWLHRMLYAARGQHPAPTIFSMNLIVYADKAVGVLERPVGL